MFSLSYQSVASTVPLKVDKKSKTALSKISAEELCEIIEDVNFKKPRNLCITWVADKYGRKSCLEWGTKVNKQNYTNEFENRNYISNKCRILEQEKELKKKKSIINTLFFAKETIRVISDSKINRGNNKVYKGVSFLIQKENIIKREKNRLLVKNLKIRNYPHDYIINGWLDLDKLATKYDAKKITKWPFKTWKTYTLTVQMDVYEFTKKGKVTAYTLYDQPTEVIDKNYGQVYLIGDIALTKHIDSYLEDLNGHFRAFAIYDKANNRLCPIGIDYYKCDEFLNSDREYNEFYLEKY